MINSKNTRFVLVLALYLLCVNGIFAQDIVPFEVVDNESVGLTVAPYSKWGMAVGDFNKDGYPDIFNIRWNGAGEYSRLYMNQAGTFLDISDQTPLPQLEGADDEGNTRTATFIDFDNDGDQDISFCTPKAIFLLRNDDNTFVDVSEEMGFVGYIPPGFIIEWHFSIGGWADYDLDGDLDCIIGQVNNDNLYLFRNDGDQFTNVATEAGLDGTVLAQSSRLTWLDFDLDGDPDIYSQYNFFRNDDGVFTDVTEEMGLGGLENSSYREMFDYDNDGDFDFFKVVGSATDAATNEMWENRDGVFVNVTADVGLAINRDRYRSMTVGDFDNDGDQDIFVQLNIDPSLDVLLVNDYIGPGERAFADVAEFIGITKTGDRKGSAFLDYNMDGWLDVYLSSAEFSHILYKNLGGNGANWVMFMLEGTQSNRDAVGTYIKIYTGDKMQVRYTKAGNGFLRQDNPHVHFGLGLETAIDSVVIHWPLGQKQVLTDVAMNQYHKVKEPDLTSVESPDENNVPQVFELEQNYPNPFNPSTNITFHLAKAENVTLSIFDVSGRMVNTLVNEPYAAGHHKVVWDGLDSQGNLTAGGMYFYRIQTSDFTETKKMVFIK
jgi:hypothetical protein